MSCSDGDPVVLDRFIEKQYAGNEGLTAYKLVVVSSSGKLSSRFNGDSWVWSAGRATLTAKCTASNASHAAPDDGCTCGVYAAATERQAREFTDLATGLVMCKVQLWGIVIQHTDGILRAQHAALVGVVAGNAASAKLAEFLEVPLLASGTASDTGELPDRIRNTPKGASASSRTERSIIGTFYITGFLTAVCVFSIWALYPPAWPLPAYFFAGLISEILLTIYPDFRASKSPDAGANCAWGLTAMWLFWWGGLPIYAFVLFFTHVWPRLPGMKSE